MTVCTPFNARFGRLPAGERLNRVTRSAQYRDGRFRNAEATPMMTGQKSRLQLLWEFITMKKNNQRPASALPLIATDLAALDSTEDAVVWLGHSSWYLQLAGKRILIDPVLSDFASPLSFINRAFAGEYPWRPQTMPDIDLLIISHDHYDHLDYGTIRGLKDKIRQALVPLGVGAHLEHWGIAAERIQESDWQQSWPIADGLQVHVLPARHFSGRGLKSNQTLWASFLFETADRKLFYSGDGGYGQHFSAIGQQFGPIDIAIIENGQYDDNWRHVHMLPEEGAQAALDLQAARVIPGHAGRFVLARHSWNDPWQRLEAASQGKPWQLLTPRLGEVVEPNNPHQLFPRWWEESCQETTTGNAKGEER